MRLTKRNDVHLNKRHVNLWVEHMWIEGDIHILFSVKKFGWLILMALEEQLSLQMGRPLGMTVPTSLSHTLITRHAHGMPVAKS